MVNEKKLILGYIGKRFQFFRKRNGYNRNKAAELLNITPRTLASYERGEREISAQLTYKMAELYHTTFNALTDYETPPENYTQKYFF